MTPDLASPRAEAAAAAERRPDRFGRTAGRLLASSSFRLALLYMGLFGASVLVLLGFLYWATAGYMDRQTDAAIESEVVGLAEQYRQRGTPGLIAVIRERIRRDPAGASVYLLAGPGFIPLIGNIDRWPEGAPDEDGWLTFRLDSRSAADDGPHSARARRFRLEGGLHLLVGRDVRELEATRALILRALAWGLGVTLLLALAGGAMMSGSLLRRIETINQASREIMQGALSRRILTRGSGDDFDQLADGLNAMLDRIQDLMQSLRQVSDNIAHDLRTPLARLRGRLELALAEEARPEARRALIEQAMEDADALLGTFAALLRIAQIESGSRRAAFAPLRLDTVLADAVEYYAPLAEERGARLELAAPAAVTVRGDRDRGFQAVANLIDNALKVSPSGGTVRVGLAAGPGGAEVAVADTGPGIPADAREKVFERFFRLDASRNAPGNGLGLSLVAAVAKLHDAAVRLEDNAPGLRAVIAFPAADGAAAL